MGNNHCWWWKFKYFRWSFKYPKNKNKNFKNKKNIGVAKSRNFGITKAKGNLICFIDSDDYWHKNKLMEQISEMKNNYNILGTSYTAFENNNIVKYRVIAKNILNLIN